MKGDLTPEEWAGVDEAKENAGTIHLSLTLIVLGFIVLVTFLTIASRLAGGSIN